MPDYESEIKTADKEYTNEAISEESLPVTSAWADVRRRFLKIIAVAGYSADHHCHFNAGGPHTMTSVLT